MLSLIAASASVAVGGEIHQRGGSQLKAWGMGLISISSSYIENDSDGVLGLLRRVEVCHWNLDTFEAGKQMLSDQGVLERFNSTINECGNGFCCTTYANNDIYLSFHLPGGLTKEEFGSSPLRERVKLAMLVMQWPHLKLHLSHQIHGFRVPRALTAPPTSHEFLSGVPYISDSFSIFVR